MLKFQNFILKNINSKIILKFEFIWNFILIFYETNINSNFYSVYFLKIIKFQTFQ